MTLTLASIEHAIAVLYPHGVPANDCAGSTNAIGRYYIKGWAPVGDVTTAYRAGKGSHPSGDYSHIASAPDNALVFFKQKAGHGILGMTPPDPGHVGIMIGGKFVSVTSFKYGDALNAANPNVRVGTVAQYLALNPNVEFWMWTKDYAGALLVQPTPVVPTATQRIVGAVAAPLYADASTAHPVGKSEAAHGLVGMVGIAQGPAVIVAGVSSPWWYKATNGYWSPAAYYVHISSAALVDLTPVVTPVTTPVVITPPVVTAPPTPVESLPPATAPTPATSPVAKPPAKSKAPTIIGIISVIIVAIGTALAAAFSH
jgi:hypothetical protein